MRLYILVLLTGLHGIAALNLDHQRYYCVDLLEGVVHFNTTAVDERLGRRMERLGTPKTIEIAGKRYDRHMQIGSGSNRVYLGVDENGLQVVIKQLINPHREYLLEYENLVTQYYLSLGMDVPKVLAVDYDRKILVKDYEEGLTYEELQNDTGMLPENDANFMRAALLSDLKNEMQRIKNFHQGFRQWLASQPASLSRQLLQRDLKYKGLISEGDAVKANFLFSLKKKKWILFDP